MAGEAGRAAFRAGHRAGDPTLETRQAIDEQVGRGAGAHADDGVRPSDLFNEFQGGVGGLLLECLLREHGGEECG
ncbi:hypothetical protein D3C71_1560520 [compost metagenome]